MRRERMDKRNTIFALVLIFLIGCSRENETLASPSASAIIRVTYGDSQTNTDEVFVPTETALITSGMFLGNVSESLDLTRTWSLPEDQVEARLSQAINVDAGNGPGLLVISVKGFDHQLATNILNQLCTYYTSHSFSHSSKVPGQPASAIQTVHVSIIQPAQ